MREQKTPIWAGNEAGSYLRLIDSCITQLEAQGPSRTCDESKEEEEEEEDLGGRKQGITEKAAWNQHPQISWGTGIPGVPRS